MEWKRMDAYQTLVARLQEKYRARDGAVSALLDEGVPGKLLARARKMRRRLADNLCMPGPAVATDAKVTARLQQDGYAIENVIITDTQIPNGEIPDIMICVSTAVTLT